MAQGTSNRSGFLGAHRAAVAAGGVAIAVLVVVMVLFLRDSGETPVRRVQDITMVTIMQPPPPPPPPPPQELPQPKMIEQPKMLEPEVKPVKPIERPKEAPPKPVQAPPTGPLGLDTKATGPADAFNLAGNPGGNGLLGGSGGSRWGWYASLVQTQIEDALSANKKTRDAAMEVEVRLWSDASGHIERVQLVSSSGDKTVDTAIVNDVLKGLKLREPPPNDMPEPIVMRVTGRRPS